MSSLDIPIRNIWLLMLYASDLYQIPHIRNSGAEDNPDKLPELIAEVLCKAVERRLHRNLTAAYRTRLTELSRVRGKILLLDTERKRLLDRGKVACRFEQLTIDTARNRYVLSALEKCMRKVKSIELIGRCRKNIGSMKRLGVSDQRTTKTELSLDQFSRNDFQDRIMVNASKFAHEMMIPNEEDGRFKFNQSGRDERWLRKLFENAVAGFYKVRATPQGWKVSPGKWLNWQIEEKSDRIDKLLPRMKTDIHLEQLDQQRKIIIDTKFNSILKPGQYRDLTLRSGYIYQIYAYIQSQVAINVDNTTDLMGMLLHPSVGETIDETVRIQGNQYRFSTIDLTASAAAISERLNTFLI